MVLIGIEKRSSHRTSTGWRKRFRSGSLDTLEPRLNSEACEPRQLDYQFNSLMPVVMLKMECLPSQTGWSKMSMLPNFRSRLTSSYGLLDPGSHRLFWTI